MEQDKLKLGIPDDEAALAPIQKYRAPERRSVWPGRVAVGLVALAWAALARKLFGTDAAQAEGVQDGPAHPPADPDAPAGPQTPNAHHIPEMGSSAALAQEEEQPDPLPENVILFPGANPAPFALSPQRWHAKHKATVDAQDDTLFFPESIEVKEFDFPKVPVFSSTRAAARKARESGDRAPDEPRPPGPTPEAPRNRAPETNGPVRLSPGRRDESFFIVAAVLLSGASDPDGDPLSILSMQAQGGEVIAHGEGEWLIKPDQGFEGELVITYDLSDGELAIGQTATALILPPDYHDVIGTAEDNLLLGMPDRDAIRGEGGDDILYGREGDDMLDGGDGCDVLIGGAGADVIYGGAGNDTVFAGAGDDIVFGEAGADALHGEDGNDYLDGGMGADSLDGGAGNDTLMGGEGCDLLDGGAGEDLVSGGAGEDRIVVAEISQASGDSYDGGEGSDTLDLNRIAESVTVDLSTGTMTSAAGEASLVSIENVTSGAGADQLVASDACNLFSGGAGEDVFVFTSLASIQNAGQGHDRITDFEPGDRIDLSQIDPMGEGYGEMRLFFAGATGEVPEARGGVFVAYEIEDGDDAHEFTVVKAKLSAQHEDGSIEDYDFEIELDGHHTLEETNFLFDCDVPA
ncbi:MAG: hypothetical protein CMO21_05680 [Thioclava sp.]|uniref:cadherin-like domain-containing protein n=1 Tax=Thioclava electrotropha TaxID=1549850 RepID=UPI000C3A56DE|nr:cadherin-like domain-containing protein [Thioclava electrotropha]MAQ36705.1 hypothetical protein [Thioclava sp.]